jgi:hypothetical protein
MDVFCKILDDFIILRLSGKVIACEALCKLPCCQKTAAVWVSCIASWETRGHITFYGHAVHVHSWLAFIQLPKKFDFLMKNMMHSTWKISKD